MNDSRVLLSLPLQKLPVIRKGQVRLGQVRLGQAYLTLRPVYGSIAPVTTQVDCLLFSLAKQLFNLPRTRPSRRGVDRVSSIRMYMVIWYSLSLNLENHLETVGQLTLANTVFYSRQSPSSLQLRVQQCIRVSFQTTLQ